MRPKFANFLLKQIFIIDFTIFYDRNKNISKERLICIFMSICKLLFNLFIMT